jgi:hypothetical protein
MTNFSGRARCAGQVALPGLASRVISLASQAQVDTNMASSLPWPVPGTA